jgi:hypothetical protein
VSKKERLSPCQKLADNFPVFQYGDVPELDEKKWSFTAQNLYE